MYLKSCHTGFILLVLFDSNMDARNVAIGRSLGAGNDETLLLACIDELKKDNRSDLISICSAMLQKHNISNGRTKSLLEALKNSARIFTVEQKGVVVYLTIQPQQIVSKKALIDGAKETTSLLAKAVKFINQVRDRESVFYV